MSDKDAKNMPPKEPPKPRKSKWWCPWFIDPENFHFPAFKPLEKMIVCSTQISIQITETKRGSKGENKPNIVRLVLADGSSTVLKMYFGPPRMSDEEAARMSKAELKAKRREEHMLVGNSLTKVVLYMSFLHLYHTLQLQTNYILITVRAMPTLGLTFLMTLNLQLSIDILNSTMFLIRNSVNNVSVFQFVLAMFAIVLSIVSYISFVIVLASKFYSNYSVLTLAQIEQTYIVSFRAFVTYLASILCSLVMNLLYASVYDIGLMPVTSMVSTGYSTIQEYNITIITVSVVIPIITFLSYAFAMSTIKGVNLFDEETQKLLNNAKLPSLLRSEASSVDFESLYLNNQPYGLTSGGEYGNLGLKGVLFTIFEKDTQDHESTIDTIHDEYKNLDKNLETEDEKKTKPRFRDGKTWTLLIENIVFQKEGKYSIRNVLSMPKALEEKKNEGWISNPYEQFRQGLDQSKLQEKVKKQKTKTDISGRKRKPRYQYRRKRESKERRDSKDSKKTQDSWEEVKEEEKYAEEKDEEIDLEEVDKESDDANDEEKSQEPQEGAHKSLPRDEEGERLKERYNQLGLTVYTATIECGENDVAIDASYDMIFNSLNPYKL